MTPENAVTTHHMHGSFQKHKEQKDMTNININLVNTMGFTMTAERADFSLVIPSDLRVLGTVKLRPVFDGLGVAAILVEGQPVLIFINDPLDLEWAEEDGLDAAWLEVGVEFTVPLPESWPATLMGKITAIEQYDIELEMAARQTTPETAD